jgi:hypothetical protein
VAGRWPKEGLYGLREDDSPLFTKGITETFRVLWKRVNWRMTAVFFSFLPKPFS